MGDVWGAAALPGRARARPDTSHLLVLLEAGVSWTLLGRERAGRWAGRGWAEPGRQQSVLRPELEWLC